ncbi:uridine kinase [Paenibacillus sp. N1-5-1-14]|uniref:uridine kinase n=1 Tax=Paenibacillus radicibacter TaxID=2972488 RepID=UPI002158FAFC|nr:uridine kinase [Paenibacillus radicibacter]MCR8642609.1 uridine kinase [Paenibacillus radicibacter]
MLIIGIAGGTGSGKTSVARSIIDKLGEDRAVIISQDNYYANHANLPFEEREALNYDHPNAHDNKLLITHLNELKQGRGVEVPVYDFVNHERSTSTLPIEPKSIVIVEGLHVLTDEDVRSALDVKVFVDTDADIRILRRVVRDMNERGRSLQSICNQYMSSVKPMHDAFIEPSKKYADVIIPEGVKNEVGVNLLMILTERYMSKSEVNM